MINILIVEDEQLESDTLRKIVAEQIQSAVIYQADTGRKALQWIDRLSSIDLALVDITLPSPDGREVIRYLRKTHYHTRVIVITATDDFELLRTLLALRIDDYLLKPVRQITLQESISNLLVHSESDNNRARELQQNIARLLTLGHYRQLNDLMLTALNESCQFGRSQALIRQLDGLEQYLAGKEGKLNSLRGEIAGLKLMLAGNKLAAHSYSGVLQALLTLSEALFDYAVEQASERPDFVARAKIHIEKNLLRTLSLSEVSASSYVSSCYMSRAFKLATGRGFSNYVRERKITLAKSLLQFSDLNVSSISLLLAWQDANYFCRIFKKNTGTTPSEYRKRSLASSRLLAADLAVETQ